MSKEEISRKNGTLIKTQALEGVEVKYFRKSGGVLTELFTEDDNQDPTSTPQGDPEQTDWSTPGDDHRNLQTSAYTPAGTIYEGDTIVVTANDPDPTRDYFIGWYNHCTTNGSFFWCNDVVGQELVFNADSDVQMTHLGGGSYEGSMQITRPGAISIVVYKYVDGVIYTDYYPQDSFLGDPDFTAYETTIDFSWGSGIVYGTVSDYVSIGYYFRLTIPATGNYVFETYSDRENDLFIDGATAINGPTHSTVASPTYSYTAGQHVDGVLEFFDFTGNTEVHLYWRFNGGAQTVIPTSAYSAKTHVNSPKQVTVVCPPGFTKVTESGYPICRVRCGDGMRHPSEECDDNDKGNGDGCSSTCTIENMWTCTGGSVSSQDACTQCTLGTSPNPTKDQ